MNARFCKRLIIALLVVAASQPLTALFAGQIIVSVDDFDRGELYCRGFKVDRAAEIDIHAVGSSSYAKSQLAAYAWIIKSGELEPVWVMTRRNTEKIKGSKYLREYDRTIELEPGEYTVYYYAGPDQFSGDVKVVIEGLEGLLKGLGELFGERSDAEDEEDIEWNEEDFDDLDVIIDESDDYDSDYLYERYFLEIAAESKEFSRSSCDAGFKRVIAEIRRPDHDLYSSVGFAVEKAVDLQVVAIGEYSEFDDLFVDLGWIIDADTRERVWTMDRFNTERAGGAKKNRIAIDQLHLEPGNYVVFYVTDDSHSFDDWNAAPPYQPDAYGITVMAANDSDLKATKPYKDSYQESAIMQLTRPENSDFLMQPFIVRKDCSVRVYAIGEYDKHGGDFVDYGWIDRVGDTNPCWEMTKRNTEHAGGTAKNRYFDDIIHLSKGEYTLGYVTDGSHTYADWNSSPPFDQRHYGISVYGVGKKFDPSVIKLVDSHKLSESVIAQITRVGDDAREHKKFRLDKPARVHIMALGEGMNREMFDYGWIENTDNGQVIWEMTYRKTRPAGGADKNRMVSDVVLLDAGKYEVIYVTDDSHSFEGWNATRPRNPHLWGITLTKEDK